MATINGPVTRENFPSGSPDQSLVLDSTKPGGVGWRTRISRLLDDPRPALSNALDAGNSAIRNLATPTAATDAATKAYADGLVLDRAYMCATKTLTGGSETGLSGGTEHWSAVLPSWTLREAENWEESSGEFEYTGTFPGSGKRVFCVTYDFQIYGGASVPFWKMLGRITKDDGTGHSLVPGSEASSDWYGYLAFIVYHQIHVVSSSSIVVVEPGDKISFQFGHYASALFNVSGLATHLLHGISLTITPADVVT